MVYFVSEEEAVVVPRKAFIKAVERPIKCISTCTWQALCALYPRPCRFTPSRVARPMMSRVRATGSRLPDQLLRFVLGRRYSAGGLGNPRQHNINFTAPPDSAHGVLHEAARFHEVIKR